MKDEEIDNMLQSAGQVPRHPDPRVLARIGDSIKTSMRPVRPLAPPWRATLGLFLACGAVSAIGAARAGFLGFAKMDSLERLIVFSALAILSWLAARTFVAQMTPGSRVRVSPPALLAFTIVALLAVFADLFRGQQTGPFVSVGIACLAAGLLHAIPAGLLCWLLLRRGFAVEPVSSGLVAGTLGGLAGVGLLELHCPNFEAAHVLLWHTAVVPVSAALGALLGWLLRFRARSKVRGK